MVFVNGSYSTGTADLRDAYPDGYGISSGFEGGLFEPPPDFAKLGEAANGFGVEVSVIEDLVPALQRGLAEVRNGVAAVVAVRVPR